MIQFRDIFPMRKCGVSPHMVSLSIQSKLEHKVVEIARKNYNFCVIGEHHHSSRETMAERERERSIKSTG